jgi:hypothetical protein
MAVWRPGTGEWWVLTSSSSWTQSFKLAWGMGADVPVPGDYDGDGKADAAVWRPSTGEWWILTSSSGNSQNITVQWGADYYDDVPLLGDFDGDRKIDLVVWRPVNAVWWLLKSSANYDRGQYSWMQWGSRLYGDVPLGAVHMRY